MRENKTENPVRKVPCEMEKISWAIQHVFIFTNSYKNIHQWLFGAKRGINSFSCRIVPVFPKIRTKTVSNNLLMFDKGMRRVDLFSDIEANTGEDNGSNNGSDIELTPLLTFASLKTPLSPSSTK